MRRSFLKRLFILSALFVFAAGLTACNLLSSAQEPSDPGNTEEHVHQFSEWTPAEEATCQKAGTEKRTCSVCGIEETRETALAPHSYGDWSVTEEATCQKEGSRKRVCSVCGNEETQTIPKSDHTYETETVEATATEEGYSVFTCSVCQHSYRDEYVAVAGAERLIYTLLSSEEAEVYAVSGVRPSEEGEGTEIVVPKKHNGKDVTSVAESAFRGSDVTRVTLPEGILLLEERCFYECKDLIGLDIPGSVEKIGESAFYGCESLSSVTVPSTVKTLSRGAFRNCFSLTYADIEADITVLPDSLFYGCSALKKVGLPEEIDEIGIYAFYGCRSLEEGASGGSFDVDEKKMILPAAVKKIGESAFYDCKNIRKVIFPTALEEIGGSAFSGCEKIDALDLPDGLRRLGSWTFEGCAAVENVTLPPLIDTVSWGLFKDCYALQEVDVSGTIGSIERSAFENCYSLTRAVLPEGIVSIAPSAFKGCRGIAQLDNVPDTVVSIGENAFYGCSGMTSVSIPESVKDIEAQAFGGCLSLTAVTLPDSVENLGLGVFGGCGALQSLTVPFVGNRAGVGVRDKNQYPFGYLFGTKSYEGGVRTTQRYYGVTFSSLATETYYIPVSLRNVTVTGGNILYGAFSYCVSLEEVTLPEGSTVLGGHAFSDCINLRSITVPDGVTSIGEAAFYGCEGLKNISVASTVAEVGPDAFYNCPVENAVMPAVVVGHVSKSELKTAVVNGGSVIEDNAFYGGGKLTNVTLSDTVTYLGKDAFYGCNALECRAAGGGLYIGSVQNPYMVFMKVASTSLAACAVNDSTVFIYDEAFKNCAALTEISLPGGVVNVGGNAFYGVSASITWSADASIERIAPYAFSYYTGTEITVPKTVREIGQGAFFGTAATVRWSDETEITEIGEYAFEGYLGSEIVIPSTVETIGERAFVNCVNVKKMRVPDSVRSIGTGAFAGCNVQEMTMPTVAIDLVPNKTLKKVTLTSGNYIGNDAFKGAVSLTEIVIPDSVISIGRNAFVDPPLAHVTMPVSAIPYIKKDLLKTLVLTSGTTIESNSFVNCIDLISVTLPEELETIQLDAFWGCEKLVEVRNLSSLTLTKESLNNGSVAKYAKNIYRNEADSNLISRDDFIIYNDNGDEILVGYDGTETALTVPTGIKAIYKYAFADCDKLTSVVLPDTVEEVGAFAFTGCGSITDFTVPFVGESLTKAYPLGYFFGTAEYDGATRIMQRYLNDESAVETEMYYIPSRLRSVTVLGGDIAYGVFSECSDLTEIVLEGGENIGGYAFYNCSKLTGFTVPDSVISIGRNAFANCLQLEELTVGAGVAEIGEEAFVNCSALDSVIYGGTEDDWCVIDFSTITSNPLFYAHDVYIGREKVNDFVISSVVEVKQYQLAGASVRSVTIPDTVTSIGLSAFDGCSELRSITIPPTVTNIAGTQSEGNPFNDCPIAIAHIPTWAMAFMPRISLTEVVLTSGEDIAENAFSGCSSLLTVTIPSGVVNIGASAFAGCERLSTIALPATIASIGENAFSGCPITDASIPPLAMSYMPRNELERVTLTKGKEDDNVIREGAFDGCRNLSSLAFDSEVTVTTIEANAFRGCANLKEISLPTTITTIASDAFSGCVIEIATVPADFVGNIPKDALKELTVIYNGVVTGGVCRNVVTLERVSIEGNVTRIGNNAFSGCTALSEVVIGDSVERIGDNAFSGCGSLSSVTLGSGLRQIGDRVFSGCDNENLAEIVLPDGLDTIGVYAFENCRAAINFGEHPSLTSIESNVFASYLGVAFTVPESVLTIESGAFSDCYLLESVFVGENVTSIEEGTFSGCYGLLSMTLPFIGGSAAPAAASRSTLFGYIFGTTSYGTSATVKQVEQVYGLGTTENYYIPVSLASVNITGGKILYGAFSNCDRLDLVTVPECLSDENNVQPYAFSGCHAEINWSNVSLTAIGEYAFAGYLGDSLTVPAGVVSVGRDAFNGCDSSVVWAESALDLSLVERAFAGYAGEELSFPERLVSVGGNAFSGCAATIDWSASPSLTTLSSDMFNGYAGARIDLPSSLTTISAYAFRNCAAAINWGDLTFGTVGRDWFNGYAGTVVSLPSGVTAVEAFAFRNCASTVDWGDSVITAFVTNAFGGYLGTEMVVPSSVRTIESGAFAGSTELLSLTVSERTETIGADAFDDCTKLETVSIPAWAIGPIPKTALVSVNVICGDTVPESAFKNVATLTTVTLTGVKEIGKEAFYGCTVLNSVIMSDAIEYIGEGAFDLCAQISTNSTGGVEYLGGVSSRYLVAFSADITRTEYALQNTTRVIYSSAFSRGVLTEITLPSGLLSIGANAFAFCAALATVKYQGNNVNSSELLCIDDGAFDRCTSLTGIDLPPRLKEIGEQAFAACTGLTDLTVPDSVETVGQGAFNGCASLQSIVLPFVGGSLLATSEESLFGYIFGTGAYSGATQVSQYYTATDHQEYYIPDALISVTIGGGDLGHGAFYGCDKITTVRLGDDVERIGAAAFYNCASIRGMFPIPSGLRSIGENAFYGCAGMRISASFISVSDVAAWCGIDFGNEDANPLSLTHVMKIDSEPVFTLTVPDSVEAISAYAFSGFTSLTTITLPAELTQIGAGAFNGCTAISAVVYQGTLASWCGVTFADSFSNPLRYGHSLYIGSDHVTSGAVVVSDVETVNPYAFYGCSAITSLTVSAGVTTIGEGAFGGCSGLESVTLPFIGGSASATNASASNLFGYIFGTMQYTDSTETVQYYSENDSVSYYVPAALASVTLTGGNVSYGAFYGCVNLTNIALPDVSAIGNKAFCGCDGLTLFEMPLSVENVGENAFASCSHLTDVAYGGSANDWCGIAFGNGQANPLNGGQAGLFLGGASIAAATVTLSAETINNYAFYNYAGLSNVTLTDAVESIGSDSFYGCRIDTLYTPSSFSSFVSKTYLRELHVTSGTTIAAGAFMNAAALEVVELSDTVTTVKANAFKGCTAMYDLDLGNGVETIEENAFYDCSSVIFVSFSLPASLTSIGANAFYDCKASVVWENATITTIGEYAFAGYKGSGFSVPASVTTIGSYAFSGADALTGITFEGNLLTSIGEKAFLNCNNNSFTSLTVPDSVTSIGSGAFSGCGKLASIVLPFVGGSASATNASASTLLGYVFGEDAFDNSVGVTQRYSADEQYSYYLPADLSSVTITGGNVLYGAFSGCGLTSVVLPSDLTEIAPYAFSFCSSLTSLSVPDTVEIISSSAFAYCGELTTVTFGENSVLTEISDNAFGSCGKLASITICGTVTTIGDNAFVGCSMLSKVTYNGSISDWCNINFGIEQANPLTIDTVTEKKINEGELVTGAIVLSGVTKIPAFTFKGTTITSIGIPDTVTSIGVGAFSGCDSLVTVDYVGTDATESNWCDIAFADETAVPLINANVYGLRINGNALMRPVVLEEGIKNIPAYAFKGSPIISIELPSSVEYIGDNAFAECYKLLEVYNKSGLTLYAGSQDNGYVACYAKEVYTESYATKLSTSEEGYISYQESDEEKCFVGYTGTETTLTVPSGFTKIYQYAFYGNVSISSVTLSSGIKEIGDNAFEGCTNLSSVTISDSAFEKIGNRAFAECGKLAAIDLPASVSSIGTDAFIGCDELGTNEYGNGLYLGNESNRYVVLIGFESDVSITIPTGTKLIYGGLSGYAELPSVNYEGTTEQWNNVNGNYIFTNVTCNDPLAE